MAWIECFCDALSKYFVRSELWNWSDQKRGIVIFLLTIKPEDYLDDAHLKDKVFFISAYKFPSTSKTLNPEMHFIQALLNAYNSSPLFSL